jgi:hypothetical protein
MNTQEQMEAVEVDGYVGTATYSPEDNKLRLYPDGRLDAETYGRLKAMGFRWGRFQGTFMAPMWTPQRFDLLVELCGSVGDELQTAEERAEVRALRFEQYQRNRVRDAGYYADKVERLTGNAEGAAMIAGAKRDSAERLARKVESAMVNAVDQWSRAEYWTGRVPAVLAHAQWKKENESLRHRRIKGLEADERREAKHVEAAQMMLDAWSSDPIHPVLMRRLADKSPEEIEAKKAEGLRVNSHNLKHWSRWLEHTRLRLAYEREAMAQAGGDMRERYDFEPGGTITGGRCYGPLQILKVNKAGGRINSLTCKTGPADQRWAGAQRIVKVEDVKSYTPPEAGAEVPKALRRKPLPLCNYPSADAVSMTTAEYKAIPERHRENAPCYPEGKKQWEARATHRRTRAWIEDDSSWGGTHKWVYLTDKKTTLPPSEKVAVPVAKVEAEPLPENLQFDLDAPTPARSAPAPTLFDKFKETLNNGGVQIVVADQLYPTPPDLAARMVEFADIDAGSIVLEPSAGTGNILAAIIDAVKCAPVAIEIDRDLAQRLSERYQSDPQCDTSVLCADFLEYSPSGWKPERVLMNPPFNGGADIKHINHALSMLNDGGRLVAICANGPRQRDQLMPLATHWEDLPAGTFKVAGTNVNTALLVIDK